MNCDWLMIRRRITHARWRVKRSAFIDKVKSLTFSSVDNPLTRADLLYLTPSMVVNSNCSRNVWHSSACWPANESDGVGFVVVAVDFVVVVVDLVVVVDGFFPFAAANLAWACANDIAGLGFGGIVDC